MTEHLERSKQHWKAGRWELAYAEANEALQLSPNSSEAALLTKHALYKLLPSKRLADRVDSLLEAAKECLRNADFHSAAELATKALKLGGASPTALYIRGSARFQPMCFDLAYVDATEGMMLMVEGLGSANLVGIKNESLRNISGYSNYNYDAFLESSGNLVEANRSLNAAAYRPQSWLGASKIRLESVNIRWNGRGEPSCVLARDDGQHVSPPVRFADLAAFLNNEQVTGSVRYLRLNADQSREPPSERDLRRLLDVNPERFSQLLFVRLTRIDFEPISSTTFNELFERVFVAENYNFFEIRLPGAVTPTSFMTSYSALLRSGSIQFSRLDLLFGKAAPVPFPVSKFTAGDIASHLNKRAASTAARVADGVADRERADPLLFITDNYLNCEGGVREAVTTLKKQFKCESLLVPTKRECGFTATFCYASPDTFPARKYGAWDSAIGERLQIGPMERLLNIPHGMPGLDKCQVTVQRI